MALRAQTEKAKQARASSSSKAPTTAKKSAQMAKRGQDPQWELLPVRVHQLA